MDRDSESSRGNISSSNRGISTFRNKPDDSDTESLSFDLSRITNGEPEWDFVLPVIPLPITTLGRASIDKNEAFDLRDLIGAIQNGASLSTIQNYLQRFDSAKMRAQLNDDIDGFPAMFYVIETNKDELVRTYVSYGGDPTAIHKPSKVPLLAFAIMHSENIQTDTTLMTATLLSLGASPNVIPSAFYLPYLQDLPEAGPSDEDLTDLDDESKQWCKGEARLKLSRTSTLSQRYYLERASKTKKPSVRQTQVAQKRNAEPLLGIANFLIGQNMAAKTLLDKLLSHLTVPSKKPLTLVFAGPSGHGKTELARRLGSLLSLELEVVDCTIFNREIELFGPRQPYVGWDKGSRLNNFLANNHEKRCIVFLDEFEKTNGDIHKTLLLPFDNGKFLLLCYYMLLKVHSNQ
jgi:ATP-dependent Clp protease ATP-binding subunit ClpA